MKDTRFYLEFPTASAKHRSGKANAGHSGNCLACSLPFYVSYAIPPHNGLLAECIAAVFDHPNSPCASTSVNVQEYLHKRCKRVSERVARAIHPELFNHGYFREEK